MTGRATRGPGPARRARGTRAALGPALRWARRLALLLALAAPSARADDSDLCILAAQDASRLSGVPVSVLMAVSLTETGRGAEARPWPWTVNLEGEGHWFDTREEAEAFAEAARAAGRVSFDVGCFQVNWRWHGENFVSVEQMFDPLANASYAAGFLKDLQGEAGDWSQAAGAYHSRTPELAARYRATFDGHLATLVAAGADEGRMDGPLALAGMQVAQGAAPVPAPRENWFPLLKAPAGGAAAPRLGSLVPIDG